MEQVKCVHTEHCCFKHSCRYGDDECPVVTGLKKQSFPCMDCRDERENFISKYVTADNDQCFELCKAVEDLYERVRKLEQRDRFLDS